MTTLEGIDISDAQPDVNWAKIAGAVDFAAIKVTEGTGFVASSFTAARVKAAQRELGPCVLYYHFARPDSIGTLMDARAECRAFVRACKARGARLGRNAVLDYERSCRTGRDTDWIKAWVDEYHRLEDRRPWIYGGATLRDENVSSTFGCPLWLAAYVSNPDPYVPSPWKGNEGGDSFRIWQYTDQGSCPGVPGPVDRNRFFGTHAELVDAVS